ILLLRCETPLVTLEIDTMMRNSISDSLMTFLYKKSLHRVIARCLKPPYCAARIKRGRCLDIQADAVV
ncbi:MAG TPA: hypothetical protein VET48_10905, partial [Steroidobacteraceae bacterium]|nr:hypothetical protein [Steroidobacteraceae bacterium]